MEQKNFKISGTLFVCHEPGNKLMICRQVCPLCLHSHMAQMKLGIGHLLKQLRDGLPLMTQSLDDTTEGGGQVSQQVRVN